MTVVPAIYGEISEAAKAAYLAWNDALLVRAEHGLDCRECSLTYVRCAVGIDAQDAEQRTWLDWNQLRRLERG